MAFTKHLCRMLSIPTDVITEVKHSTLPSAKPITLNLVYYHNVYKVSSVSNTTHYLPGQWMSMDVATQCAAIGGWTVNAADNQIMASIFGMLKSAFPIPVVG